MTNPPDLDPATAIYWRIFQAVDGDRPIGMIAGYIPSAAIITYATRVESIDDRRELARTVRMVRAIDDECIKAAPKQETSPPNPTGAAAKA